MTTRKSTLTTEPAAPEGRQCDRCQGNGEVVTDWDRYRHPHDGDVGDEAVAECPDCNGEGVTADLGSAEGQQEAVRIGDAVLDWMVKFDLLDAGNEYYVSDVLAVLNDLTPSTRPSEQAVTEAMVERLAQHLATDHIAIDDRAEYSWNAATEQWRNSWRRKARAALKAAMEAVR